MSMNMKCCSATVGRVGGENRISTVPEIETSQMEARGDNSNRSSVSGDVSKAFIGDQLQKQMQHFEELKHESAKQRAGFQMFLREMRDLHKKLHEHLNDTVRANEQLAIDIAEHDRVRCVSSEPARLSQSDDPSASPRSPQGEAKSPIKGQSEAQTLVGAVLTRKSVESEKETGSPPQPENTCEVKCPQEGDVVAVESQVLVGDGDAQENHDSADASKTAVSRETQLQQDLKEQTSSGENETAQEASAKSHGDQENEPQPEIAEGRQSRNMRASGALQGVKEGVRRLTGIGQRSASRREYFDGDGESAIRARRWTMTEVEDHEQRYGKQASLLEVFVASNSFSLFTMFLISTNTGFIAYQIQQAADNPYEEVAPVAVQAVDIAYCVLFVVELLCRILVERGAFFTSSERLWNIFDLTLVVLQVQDKVATLVMLFKGNAAEAMQQKSDEESGPFLRFLRTLRVLRVLRIVRLFKHCPQLVSMLNEIMSSFSSVIWLFLLLGLILFMCALVFMTATIDVVRDGAVDEARLEYLKSIFGSIPAAILVLFKAMSGGLEWAKIGDALMDISPMYGAVFISFIAFVLFGAINVVVAVFVQNATNNDRDATTKSRIQNLEAVSSVISELDDGEGYVKRSLLVERLRDKHVVAILQAAHVQSADLSLVLDLLDLEGVGKVPSVEFLHGVLRLAGESKSADVVMLHLEHSRLAQELRQFMRQIEVRFGAMYKALRIKGFSAIAYSKPVPSSLSRVIAIAG
eukprot:TRINITY_DN30406_c0_g1_i1.p1 TRINITY_DN30406_c0_g1~~TRINITY_DN30406_c0_g1_i1.p1  ORF type:complete len:751 (+),score=118.09 TRINITY_DN30406_c0_g1_i1:70-2322(+)